MFKALKDYKSFTEELEKAKSIVTKFVDNFFIKDMLTDGYMNKDFF